MGLDFRQFKINFQIQAKEVRLIDDQAKQIGVMSIDEARKLSQEAGKDLIEVVSKANPPIVKLIEFSKFKYQESKKDRANRKGDKGSELKELQFTPFIGQGDFDNRVNRAKEFFSSGNKVKISVEFKGRQKARPEFGHTLVQKFKAQIAEFGEIESEPKMLGKYLFAIFKPIKKK